MSLSSTCIKRPVLATVLNLILVIVGSIGLLYLGVRDYPSVDPPVISDFDLVCGCECGCYRNADYRAVGIGN